MARIRIFVSFDGDNDSDLHDQLDAQASRRGAPFELSACSQSGAMTDAWAARARTRIRDADEVVAICGEHTHASPRMAAELRMAREEGTPCLLVWGRRERMCKKPDGAKPGDVMYSWTRRILEGQMSETLRNAKPRKLPERAKRPRA